MTFTKRVPNRRKEIKICLRCHFWVCRCHWKPSATISAADNGIHSDYEELYSRLADKWFAASSPKPHIAICPKCHQSRPFSDFKLRGRETTPRRSARCADCRAKAWCQNKLHQMSVTGRTKWGACWECYRANQRRAVEVRRLKRLAAKSILILNDAAVDSPTDQMPVD